MDEETIIRNCDLCGKELECDAGFATATWVFCEECTKKYGGPSGAAGEMKRRLE